MNSTLQNVLAFVVGAIAGGLINWGIVMIGDGVIGAPEGIDMTTMESLKANIHLLTPKFFIFPFLAHALGTLGGAFIATKIAVSKYMKIGLGIGVFFLLGGIAMVMSVGGPLWFSALDLIAAYLPMGYLGVKLARRK